MIKPKFHHLKAPIERMFWQPLNRNNQRSGQIQNDFDVVDMFLLFRKLINVIMRSEVFYIISVYQVIAPSPTNIAFKSTWPRTTGKI